MTDVSKMTRKEIVKAFMECVDCTGATNFDEACDNCKEYRKILFPTTLGNLSENEVLKIKEQEQKMGIIDEDKAFRTRVVHGWAFRHISSEDVKGIRWYLKTGERRFLPDTYKKIAEGLSK